jgi:hypothetical protein
MTKKKSAVKKTAKRVVKKKNALSNKIIDMNISDLRADLKRCVADVHEGRSIIVIRHYGQPIAKVVPL